MKEGNKIICIWTIIVLFVGILFVGLYYQFRSDDQHIIIDEKIVDTEIIDASEYTDDNYHIYYLKIITESGKEYIIDCDDEYLDLTVNSKLILELFNNGIDEVWEVRKIYKVPD